MAMSRFNMCHVEMKLRRSPMLCFYLLMRHLFIDHLWAVASTCPRSALSWLCHQATCKWNEQPFDGTSSGDEKIHWLPEEDPGQLQPLEDPELWQGHSSQLRLQVDP